MEPLFVTASFFSLHKFSSFFFSGWSLDSTSTSMDDAQQSLADQLAIWENTQYSDILHNACGFRKNVKMFMSEEKKQT